MVTTRHDLADTHCVRSWHRHFLFPPPGAFFNYYCVGPPQKKKKKRTALRIFVHPGGGVNLVLFGSFVVYLRRPTTHAHGYPQKTGKLRALNEL